MPAAGAAADLHRQTGLAEFLRRLNASATDFSRNDATIADFLRRNAPAVALSTAEQLAQQTGVSKAAVVRFANRLGYAGFTALRDELRRHILAERASRRTFGESYLGTVRALVGAKLSNDLASLSRVVETVDQRELLHCAEILADSSARVFVTGHRRGFAMAMLAHRQLNWVRSGVRLWREEELGIALALDEIAPGDVVLAFAFRRYPRVTGVVLEYARAVGATSILVSDSLTCPYASLGDSVFVCPSADGPAFDSSVPVVFFIESLAGLMVQLLGAEVDERVRVLHDARHSSHLEDANVRRRDLRSLDDGEYTAATRVSE